MCAPPISVRNRAARRFVQRFSEQPWRSGVETDIRVTLGVLTYRRHRHRRRGSTRTPRQPVLAGLGRSAVANRTAIVIACTAFEVGDQVETNAISRPPGVLDQRRSSRRRRQFDNGRCRCAASRFERVIRRLSPALVASRASICRSPDHWYLRQIPTRGRPFEKFGIGQRSRVFGRSRRRSTSQSSYSTVRSYRGELCVSYERPESAPH